jgi:hypothetical protein
MASRVGEEESQGMKDQAGLNKAPIRRYLVPLAEQSPECPDRVATAQSTESSLHHLAVTTVGER